MKILRTVVVISGLAVLSSLGVLIAAAAGTTGTSPSNSPYVDNRNHTIAGHANVWYRFDYAIGDSGDRPVTTSDLWMETKMD